MNRKIGSRFFYPKCCFFVCVTLSRYMKIGENLLNEVPVEKSILVDFDQFITLVNNAKLNGFMKDIQKREKRGQ